MTEHQASVDGRSTREGVAQWVECRRIAIEEVADRVLPRFEEGVSVSFDNDDSTDVDQYRPVGGIEPP